mmetsp:Transcript_70171/g.139149  ORF Transcript_70171/g.139149 Transcript_70171/m.139149 type:complete len:228 (-) Transcript_70171:163-846(-)
MPTRDHLLLLQAEFYADDIPLDEHMESWTEDECVSYFESGGTLRPAGSGNSFGFRPATSGHMGAGLQVIGAGFGRTGTESTKIALDQLGYTTHHFGELSSEWRTNLWLELETTGTMREPDGTARDLAWYFSELGYTATVDTPANLHYKELMAAFPEAKVVLTVHPRGGAAWLRSFKVLEFFETVNNPFLSQQLGAAATAHGEEDGSSRLQRARRQLVCGCVRGGCKG